MESEGIQYEEITINGRVLRRPIPHPSERQAALLRLQKSERETPEASRWSKELFERIYEIPQESKAA